MEYSQIRARARESLSGKWALSVAVCLVAYLLGGTLIGSSFLPQITYTYRGEAVELADMLRTLTTLSHRFGGTTLSITALGLAQLILGGTVQLGYATYLLKQQDHQEAVISDLFSEFHRFGQGFAQKFLRGLYIFLWSLLFVIPGIVKTFSYAMTPFLMAEHPELSPSEAIDRSRQLMDGHKGELFMLRLTFLGWDVVAALTGNIGNLVLNPYKNAAEAAFYRQITRPHDTQEV